MKPEPIDHLPDIEVDSLRREGLFDGQQDDGRFLPHDGTSRVELSFTPSGQSVRVPSGVTMFDAASWNGIAIDSTCGGHGTCKKCKLKVADPNTAVHRLDRRSFTEDQLTQGWRLACLAQALRSIEVEVPPLTTRPKAATVGVGRQVILRPAVQKRYIEMETPSLSDQRTDVQRVRDAIPDLHLTPGLAALRRMPGALREGDFCVTAVIADEALIDVEVGDTRSRSFAIAFDLGTTTVAEVLAEGQVSPSEVYEVALAGNATMTALILGIDPEPLGIAPFVMSNTTIPTFLASELGLDLHAGARASVFPALSAYVGGDIVAGMLATGMDRDKRTRLFIDVGTNCEIVLSSGDTIVFTAAPAGPAFEGGAVRCGMRAAGDRRPRARTGSLRG